MFRKQLESLETRETPASAHTDLYLNVWINPSELPAAEVRPVEEIGFVYHKIDLHAGGDISLKGSKILQNSPVDKDETITISQNRTEAAIAFVGGWGSSMYRYG